MKKYIKFFFSALLVSALFASCEKEPMTYQGKDSIYFDIRRGAEWINPDLWAHEYYSTVSFGSTMDDVIELDLPVCVSGMPSNIDREFTIIEVKDSTTVQSGDYTGLQQTYTIKAGETKTNVHLTFSRKAHMKNDTLQLQLALVANEHFELMYKDFGTPPQQYEPSANAAFGYNRDAGVHNIFVFDVMTRPKQWQGNDESGLGTLGKFSATKWKLMMKLSGTTISDYESSTTMPTARMQAIGQTCLLFVIEKANARTPVLDEDGSMMFFFKSGITNPWQPFTTPEEYYGDSNYTPFDIDSLE